MYTGNILLFDEERSARASYANSLKDAGFSVTSAKDGVEALRRLENGRFDVVLADICMPEKNGLELLQKLHASSPDVPVIVMVLELNNRFAVEAAELGAVQLLKKPIDKGLLRRTVARAVGLKQARQERPSVGPWVRGSKAVRMTATTAKNRMGEVLDKVMQGEVVLITRHETPKAAVIPMAEYAKLSGAPDEGLAALSRKYDAMLARMQTPAARKGMKAAFDAKPKQLGRAAVAFARKHG